MMPTRKSPSDTSLRHHIDQVLEDISSDLVDSSLGTFGCFLNIQRRINSVFDGCMVYEVSLEQQYMHSEAAGAEEESTTPGGASSVDTATVLDNPAPPPKSTAPPLQSTLEGLGGGGSNRSRSRSRSPPVARLLLTPKAPLAPPPIQLRLKGKPIGARII